MHGGALLHMVVRPCGAEGCAKVGPRQLEKERKNTDKTKKQKNDALISLPLLLPVLVAPALGACTPWLRVGPW